MDGMGGRSAAATDSLTAHTTGDPDAAARLLPLVYDQLKELARHYMQAERRDHTLQPTALVHEAYLRLIHVDRIDWQGKTHFLAMAATQMRRVLVEHARAAGAKKRGARPQRITLDEAIGTSKDRVLETLALDQALRKLETHSERQARIVELRVFAGLDHDETALALDVSKRTVQRDWKFARAWLARELNTDH